MVLDALANLSWFAVVVSVVAYYLLGALWFTPLFGRAWDEAIGHSRDDGSRFAAAYYLVPLAGSMLVTVAMAVILAVAAPAHLADALGLAAVVGVGIALAVSVTNALTPHTPRPFRLGLITGGYHLVGILGVTVLLTVL